MDMDIARAACWMRVNGGWIDTYFCAHTYLQYIHSYPSIRTLRTYTHANRLSSPTNPTFIVAISPRSRISSFHQTIFQASPRTTSRTAYHHILIAWHQNLFPIPNFPFDDHKSQHRPQRPQRPSYTASANAKLSLITSTLYEWAKHIWYLIFSRVPLPPRASTQTEYKILSKFHMRNPSSCQDTLWHMRRFKVNFTWMKARG